jgi:hypothetical protein
MKFQIIFGLLSSLKIKKIKVALRNHLAFCLCSYHPIVAQQLGKHAPAATNTHTTKITMSACRIIGKLVISCSQTFFFICHLQQFLIHE